MFVSKILNLLNNGQHFLYLHVELMCNLLTIQPPSVLIYKQLLLTELMEYYFCHKIPFNQKEKKTGTSYHNVFNIFIYIEYADNFVWKKLH